ncbi:hypothetical protein [Comamonas endophytica]|uniref:Uncharacterized protein n=1 Tax=Comamonas endophytica TaxID=2949090 RepID=A0ABY6GF86_9BURK|nr:MULTISPECIES: hypothetical protein [unclassified Acidovorax]MCD2514470.1 hypothetical protein [Acidovorax sp. D4N7]UYG53759.1 hypothetical protein M9799_17645 [Acidovorax sp. 5MLIR]
MKRIEATNPFPAARAWFLLLALIPIAGCRLPAATTAARAMHASWSALDISPA